MEKYYICSVIDWRTDAPVPRVLYRVRRSLPEI